MSPFKTQAWAPTISLDLLCLQKENNKEKEVQEENNTVVC